MKQSKSNNIIAFKDVVKMFDLLQKQGYSVEQIMDMKIDIIADVKELVWQNKS